MSDKSLYPSLAYRLFHSAVFDTAENRNQPLRIVVCTLGTNFKETIKEYHFNSVTDVPFDLLRMSCYHEPTKDDDAYRLCGYPTNIDGKFIIRYEIHTDPFTIRSLLRGHEFPTVGIVVDLLSDDEMIVMYPTEDYRLEKLPRDIYGKTRKGIAYFRSMREFMDSGIVTRRK